MILTTFFYLYIGLMLLLGIKKYVPPLKRLFNNHPIGEWGMYSVPVRDESKFHAYIRLRLNGREVLSQDITEICNAFLWHNFQFGRFVTFTYSDFPFKAYRRLAGFLSDQPGVQRVGNDLLKRWPSDGDVKGFVELEYEYRLGEDGVRKVSSSAPLKSI